MRTSTKLKHLLLRYKVELSALDGMYTLKITDTKDGTQQIFESFEWSKLTDEAYKHYKKILDEA